MILKTDWPPIRPPTDRCPYYVIDGRPLFKKAYKKTMAEAKTLAAAKRVEAQNNGKNGSMELDLRADAIRAAEKLEKYNVTVLKAAEFYVERAETLAKQGQMPVMEKALAQWANAAEVAYLTKKRSKYTAKEIGLMSKVFANQWRGRIPASVTPGEVRRWLNSLVVSERTQMNYRTKLSQFFNWCRVEEWITSNPCELIRFEPKDAEVRVLPVHECETLIEKARGGRCEAYLLIGLFAGLRPGELSGLCWEDIEHKQVMVRAETSKTRQTRYVPVHPSLWRRLQKIKGKGSITGANWRKTWEEFRASCGYFFELQAADYPESELSWHENAMRHSFASYWLPIHNDRAKLAEIMGNSVDVIRNHYRKAIPKKEAVAFWRLISSI